ncbi:MAG TPA: type II toxin-antitoxin system VapC family toxin [Gammaproteobacteria bacterium]|nr:type II toxin-antitoxin system VapC family toxin [Gammaproteobacteria bacterium]
MSDSVYLDTSALAKWYLNEHGTKQVTDFILSADRVVISSLTITEMRCLLARRKRMHDFNEKIEHQLYATFLNDIDIGHLTVEVFSDQCFIHAAHLIDSFPSVPLRTLDALHLSIIQQKNIPRLATADEVMLKAAKKMNIKVKKF